MTSSNSNLNELKRKVSKEGHFEVYQFNCNSMSRKVSELKLYLYTRKPEILCLCETWLKRNEPKFVGYTAVWHTDYKTREG